MKGAEALCQVHGMPGLEPDAFAGNSRRYTCAAGQGNVTLNAILKIETARCSQMARNANELPRIINPDDFCKVARQFKRSAANGAPEVESAAHLRNPNE